MQGKSTFVKRKKFTKEATAADRLLERWNQQVFMILQKFPQAASAIAALRETHAKRLGSAFVPSEESLADLAELRLTLT